MAWSPKLGGSLAVRHHARVPCSIDAVQVSTSCAQALATVVSDHMGGARDYESLSSAYSEFQAQLKDRLQSRILPIGALSVGLARHRALLFKTLADACELPCRLLRGPAIGMRRFQARLSSRAESPFES